MSRLSSISYSGPGGSSYGSYEEAAAALQNQNDQREYQRMKQMLSLIDGGGSGGGSGSRSGSGSGGGAAAGASDQDAYRERALAGFEESAELTRKGIREDYDTLGQNALADLSDRGLSGSNLNVTTRLGTERAKNRDLNDLQANLLNRRASSEASYAGNQASLQGGANSARNQLLNNLLGGFF